MKNTKSNESFKKCVFLLIYTFQFMNLKKYNCNIKMEFIILFHLIHPSIVLRIREQIKQIYLLLLMSLIIYCFRLLFLYQHLFRYSFLNFFSF